MKVRNLVQCVCKRPNCRGHLCDYRRKRHDEHRPLKSNDKQQIQSNVDKASHHHKIERRLGVPKRTQHGRDAIVRRNRQNARAGYTHIYHCVLQNNFRRIERRQHPPRRGNPDYPHEGRDCRQQIDAVYNTLLDHIHPLRAKVLRNHNAHTCRNAKTHRKK